MLEFLSQIPPGLITGGTVTSILVLSWWMLATGAVVTRRENQQIVEDRNYWRQAHDARVEADRLRSESINKLLENSKTTLSLLEALPKAQQPPEISDDT